MVKCRGSGQDFYGEPCGCKKRCILPPKKKIHELLEKDCAPFVVDGKVWWITVGTSFEKHGDGTEIYTEHHITKPDKITTLRPNGRMTVVHKSVAQKKRERIGER